MFCNPPGIPGAHGIPLPMEFSRQEYWSGLPCPSPGDLPDPGIEPGSSSLPTEPLEIDSRDQGPRIQQDWCSNPILPRHYLVPLSLSLLCKVGVGVIISWGYCTVGSYCPAFLHSSGMVSGQYMSVSLMVRPGAGIRKQTGVSWDE